MRFDLFGFEFSIKKKAEPKRLYELEAQKAVNILADHFLGEKWYIVDPVCNIQANAIIVYEIMRHYPNPKWPRKWKTRGEHP